MRFFNNIGRALLLSIILISCNGDKSENKGKRAEGSGGSVRIAEVTAPKTLFPHTLTNLVEGMVATQIHEGLVRLNPKTLEPVPGLAEKWEISEDGKTITFHLRKGARFQNNSVFSNGKGPEITSKDVKFTFELLCTESANNLHFGTVCKDRIIGAEEFFEASSKGQKSELKGLKIIDDYTFSISLKNASTIFLQILANPVASILSEEAYRIKKERLTCGAGPFVYDTVSSNESHIVLIRNENYYGKDEKGNSLPYIDSVILDVLPSIEDVLSQFKAGKCDFIGSLPSSSIKQIVEENIKEFQKSPPSFILERDAEMISQYYIFNLNRPPFNNVKLRQAFCYAIDRDRIIEKVLRGQAFGPSVNGITPPTFPTYKISTLTGYDLNVEKAKKLLSEAGYPGGIGLQEIAMIINSGNSRNNTVAAEIQKQLKENLNVNVTFESLPNADKFNLQVKGMGDMFRDGWVADYPSPESFLSVFYGSSVPKDTSKISYPNTQRYFNPEFDKYYEMGRDAKTKDSANVYFLKAEQIMLNDAPIIPLWYESNYRLISSRLKNFIMNPLRYFDFTKVMVVQQGAEAEKAK